jgi:hypothetical protein
MTEAQVERSIDWFATESKAKFYNSLRARE